MQTSLTLVATLTLPMTVSAQDGGARHASWQILEGIDLSAKTIESGDGATSIGVGYKIRKDLYVSGDLHADLTADGTIALGDQFNPEDFLDTKGVIGYTIMDNGVRKRDDAGPPPRDVDLRDYVDDGAYLDLGLVAGLESDQRFTSKQWTYGAKAEFWYSRSAKNPSWWNVFDYPASLVRYLTGNSEPEPRAKFALPAVCVAIDQVDGSGNDKRSAVTTDSEFARFRLEASMRSSLGTFGAQDLSLSAVFRHYHELGADEATKSADIDHSSFVALTLSANNGMFLRYTDGSLPLDLAASSSFQLGWSTNPGVLFGGTPTEW